MPLFVGQVIEGILYYLIFLNVRKDKANLREFILITVSLVATSTVIFSLGLYFGITAIIVNSLYILILSAIIMKKVEITQLVLVYSIFAVLIVLLSGHLASVSLNIIHLVFPDSMEFSRDGVMGSLAMSTIYIVQTFAISYFISKKLGDTFHVQIITFDDDMKKKLATHILLGAAITLGIFFMLVFLREPLEALSVITLAYALSLSIIFLYLMFAAFAFSDNIKKGLELKQKDKLLQALEAYTKNAESAATEMRLFKHDHQNLLLGFHAHAENKDWDAFKSYYEEHVGAFNLSIRAMNASYEQLCKIETPEIKAIMVIKTMQANDAKIDMVVEISKKLTIVGGYNLLDSCRIMGILLDNAIEACRGVSGAKIRLLGTMSGDSAYFVLKNTFETPPPMNLIAKKGFTTKEGERGMGLYNVAKIVAKNNCLTLSTSIKQNMFVQELEIASGE